MTRKADILGKDGIYGSFVGHAELVAQEAVHILDYFGYWSTRWSLEIIAGYLHDIGNAINRSITRNTDRSLQMIFLRVRTCRLRTG